MLTCCNRGKPRLRRRVNPWSPVPGRCRTQASESRGASGIRSCTRPAWLSLGRAAQVTAETGLLQNAQKGLACKASAFIFVRKICISRICRSRMWPSPGYGWPYPGYGSPYLGIWVGVHVLVDFQDMEFFTNLGSNLSVAKTSRKSNESMEIQAVVTSVEKKWWLVQGECS